MTDVAKGFLNQSIIDLYNISINVTASMIKTLALDHKRWYFSCDEKYVKENILKIRG